MYDLCANTLFLGKKIVYLPSCHSTNDIAAELVRYGTATEGTVVITDFQTAGRGQRGTQWLTAQGQNLTLSIIFRPTFLIASEQFLLSQVVALGTRDYLACWTPEAQIKWPNDLYIRDAKVGGVLIENTIQGSRINYSIVGIGLNINQLDFTGYRATSLKRETGHELDLNRQLPALLAAVEQVYLRLRSGHYNEIRHRYLAHLLGIGQRRIYRSQGEVFQGSITGVTPTGKLRLRIEQNDQEKEFDIKEIEWIWEN